MKSMKKLMALLLVVVLTLALGTTAFADSSDGATGSITITNTDAFDPAGTYTAYKIFDVTYADGTDADGAFSYTISSTSPWLATVQTYFDTVAAASDNTVLVATPKNGYDAATFAAALKTAYDAMTTKPTGTTLAGEGNEALALGYWFVTTTTGSLCNLTTTHPNSVIHDKNEPTPFDKELASTTTITGSVQVGDTVPYEITGKVPSTVGYSQYIYEVSDTISGAVFQKNVAVKFGTTTITPSTTELVQTATGFTLTFDMTKYQAYVDQPISITYTAVVDDSSLEAGEVVNTATLKHSHDPANPTNTKKEPDVKIILKTFTIDLTKVAEDGTSPLKDAQFILKNGEGKYYTYDETNETVVWVANKADAMVVTTGATGKGDKEFKGLEAGTYDMIEIKAPYGYNLPKDPFTVVITESGTRTVTETADLITKEYTYTAKVNGEDANINNLSNVITTIENNAGALLPETGGFGTTMLIVLGSVLFMATAIVLVTKKRMYNEG